MTDTMKRAMDWFRAHGDSGVVDRYGRMLVGGETGGWDASTWLRLIAVGKMAAIDGRFVLID